MLTIYSWQRNVRSPSAQDGQSGSRIPTATACFFDPAGHPLCLSTQFPDVAAARGDLAARRSIPSDRGPMAVVGESPRCRGWGKLRYSTEWLTTVEPWHRLYSTSQLNKESSVADDQLSRVFAALADPTRRDMVARLAVGDATVGELADPYDVSVQAVSKHVKVLTDAGLVSQTQGRPAAAVPSRSGGLRPDDEVDRAVPPTGPGALRPPRRRPGRDARRRTTHQPRKPKQGAAS